MLRRSSDDTGTVVWNWKSQEQLSQRGLILKTGKGRPTGVLDRTVVIPIQFDLSLKI